MNRTRTPRAMVLVSAFATVLLIEPLDLFAETAKATPTVGWTSSLAGPSRTDLEKAARAPWTYAYDTRNTKTGEERKISSCAEAEALPAGFEPATDQDLRSLQGDRVRCQVMQLFLEATPAAESHFARFALGDALLAKLPASLIPTPSLREERKLDEDGARGVSWKKADPKIRMVKKTSNSMTVESPKTRAILTVLGHGDLNGDGVEDLVLERAGGNRKGTWSTTEAFIITRRSNVAPLEVTRRVR